MNDYVEKAIRTESCVEVHLTNEAARILHAAMGCVTEAGEMMDAVKKHIFYGKPLDDVNLVEEAGDLLWYVAVLSDTLAVPLEDIMRRNIEKLRKRYPTKFTEEDALDRDLDEERAVLERDSLRSDSDDIALAQQSSELREASYLRANGWHRLTEAMDGKRETWAVNHGGRQSIWPKPVLLKHGHKAAFSREDALNLQREIDWMKGI